MTETEQPRVIHLSETASTNADAWRYARANEPLPLWVQADWQTAGRGRSGRAWTPAKGNLFASLATTTTAPQAVVGQLALVAAVAIFDTVRAFAPAACEQGLRLKWPNDVLVGSAKLAGVLVECASLPGREGLVVVIGIGLNIACRPPGLERDSACLADFVGTVHPEKVLTALHAHFSQWQAEWSNGQAFSERILPAWQERAGPMGEPLSVRLGNESLHGRYAGLDASGYLLLETADGRQRTISHGDVALSGGLGSEGSQ